MKALLTDLTIARERELEEAIRDGDHEVADRLVRQINHQLRLQESIRPTRIKRRYLFIPVIVLVILGITLNYLPMGQFEFEGRIRSNVINLETSAPADILMDVELSYPAAQVEGVARMEIDARSVYSSGRIGSQGDQAVIRADVIHLRMIELRENASISILRNPDESTTLSLQNISALELDLYGQPRVLSREQGSIETTALGGTRMDRPLSSVRLAFIDGPGAMASMRLARTRQLPQLPPLPVKKFTLDLSVSPNPSKDIGMSGLLSAELDIPATGGGVTLKQGQGLQFSELEGVAYSLSLTEDAPALTLIGNVSQCAYGFPWRRTRIQPSLLEYVMNVVRQQTVVIALLGALAVGWTIYARFGI